MDFEGSDKKAIGRRLQSVRLKKLIEKLEVTPPENDRGAGASASAGEELITATPVEARVGGSKAVGHRKKSKTVGKLSKSILINKEEESEILLRRLIAIESDWQDMKPYAWDIFEKWPTTEIAGKIIELSYLHGQVSDVVSVLGHVKGKNIAGYFAVAVDLRPYIVLKLWQQGCEGVLNHYLHHKAFQGMLLRIEKLFVFWSLYGATDQAKAWRFYTQNQKDIQNAVKEYGSSLRLRQSMFDFEVGKLAHRLGKHTEARSLLERIKPDAPEFKDALEMLIRFKVDLDANGNCMFGRRLAQENGWRNRIKLFRSFFESMDRSNGIRHQERAALNSLLAKPMRWFPESAEAISQLSRLLVEYQCFDYLLPNVMQLFKANSMKFHAPVFERALWEPLFSLDCNDHLKKSYWVGMATLHKFVGNQFKNEALLWQAKDLIESGMESEDKSVLSWDKIHRELLHWASRSPSIHEEHRKDLVSKIRVVGHHLDVTETEIQQYIRSMEIPDFPIIDRMMTVIRKRNDLNSEMRLVQKKGELSHFTNQSLNRLWQISCINKKNDIAWRVGSLLYSRHALAKNVEGLWALSGEKRQEKRIRVIPAKNLINLYQDWPQRDREFAESFLLVAAKLPELLSFINKKVRPHKRLNSSKEDLKFDELLVKSPWLQQGKKVYSSHPEQLHVVKPPYADALPETPWTRIFANVTDRLGLNAWQWDITLLHDELESIIPRAQSGRESQGASRIGRWLRTLSPLQRKAWYKLFNASGQLGYEEACLILGKLVNRITTSIYQDHVDALDSVSRMEASLELRWDLERFIISDNYSVIREAMFSSSSFDVPQSAPQDALVK